MGTPTLSRLWRFAERARATFGWWGFLAFLGIAPAVPPVQGFFEGQPWSVLFLYGVVALAFWIVVATEWKAISAERRERRSPIGRLMALRADGVQILNRNVSNDGAILLHRAAVDEWDKLVGLTLKEAGAPPSDIGWFTTLGVFPIQFSSGNAMYLKYQNILAEKLERLLVIVRRLEESKG